MMLRVLILAFSLTALGAATPSEVPVLLARLRAPMPKVELRDVPAREAFEWWSKQAGVPLVMDWVDLEREGLFADTPITLKVRGLSAERVLVLLTRQLQPGALMVMELSPGYLRLMSRAQANRETVVRVYGVKDLLTQPVRRDSMRRETRSAQNRQVGGSSGGTITFEPRKPANVKRGDPDDSGESLAQLIRDIIEPNIWQENGGQYSSVQYHRGTLVVNAPVYVHGRIERQFRW